MTAESLLPLALNKQVRNFLLQNVLIKKDTSRDALGHAAICLTRTGYTLLLGSRYFSGTDNEKITILLHEMAHILRGDCVHSLKQKHTLVQCRLWGVAADAVINFGLAESQVKALDGIWYSSLVDKFENTLPREYLPSTQEIFTALEKATYAGGSSDALFYEQDANESDLRREHSRALLNAREMLAEVPEMLDYIGSLSWDNSAAVGRRRIEAAPYPIPLASILLKHLSNKCFGKRIHQRTYLREGRVEGLRGASLLPRINVLAAIDVSGSCSHLVERFVGASKWLAKRHLVNLVAFDTQLYKYGPDVAVGGGTCFQPVYNYAEASKYDAVIMLSDGCAGDVTPMPKVPLIWVVPKEFQRPPLRSNDKLIILQDT